jgi:hypothetical protein
MILALFGRTLGFGLAYLAIRSFKALPIPTDLPVVIGVQLDPRVPLASLLAAIVSALIFGVRRPFSPPAIRSARATSVNRRPDNVVCIVLG